MMTEEDAQGMANVDEGVLSPETAGEQPSPPARTRAGKPAGPAFKPMHHEDMDPEEFAAMLGIYDDSFRNMAEGEVVKGTVLKVTDTAVVVDVGYKSEGLIQIIEFLDENGEVTVQPGDVVTFAKGPYVRVVEIVALGARRGPAAEAQALYRDLNPPESQPKPERPNMIEPGWRAPGAGRPTKKQRRETDRLQGGC
ncbi:MAG: hypothetical protein CFH40_01915 [Alphaproteobacteria bacterium MarineAlpha10_Bin3]|nr:MAG: hypothetical protein CFH40_01915 [Alphaproteobacteria bacterium MarineAlpha10_Bin3]PPR68853.1 MAG: hypothetical protein CFH09_01915 [Alphaproteobacteria bacterium MarineAlpha4_Bin1]